MTTFQEVEDAIAMISVEEGGTFEVIAIADLRTDPSYQREISLDLVNKIAKNWDYKAAGAIKVSRRPNGELFIVDGQHRAAGASEAGKTHLVCQVVSEETAEREAKLRLTGNMRRTDTPSERFRAQVAAGDEQSIDIVRICDSFDTEINRTPQVSSGINAVSAVEAIYKTDSNGVLLTRVLEFIQDVYGVVGGRSTNVAVLKSVAWLLQKHSSDMNRDRMVERLRGTGLDNLRSRAINYHAVHGGTEWSNYYRAMIEIYNEKLAEKAKLEWRLGGRAQRYPGWGKSG